jgi:hypothetical protein
MDQLRAGVIDVMSGRGRRTSHARVSAGIAESPNRRCSTTDGLGTGNRSLTEAAILNHSTRDVTTSVARAGLRRIV